MNQAAKSHICIVVAFLILSIPASGKEISDDCKNGHVFGSNGHRLELANQLQKKSNPASTFGYIAGVFNGKTEVFGSGNIVGTGIMGTSASHVFHDNKSGELISDDGRFYFVPATRKSSEAYVEVDMEKSEFGCTEGGVVPKKLGYPTFAHCDWANLVFKEDLFVKYPDEEYFALTFGRGMSFREFNHRDNIDKTTLVMGRMEDRRFLYEYQLRQVKDSGELWNRYRNDRIYKVSLIGRAGNSGSGLIYNSDSLEYSFQGVLKTGFDSKSKNISEVLPIALGISSAQSKSFIKLLRQENERRFSGAN